MEESIRFKLKSLVNRLKNFDRNELWEETDYYKKIIDFIGQEVPIGLIESVLSFYKKKRKDIAGKEIPEILREIGADKILTEDGKEIRIKKYYSGKIINKMLFFSWLELNGLSDHVKNIFEFGKGEADRELKNFLQEKGYTYTMKETVHPQTLKKIIKDRMESGETLPSNSSIEISVYEEAKVTE